MPYEHYRLPSLRRLHNLFPIIRWLPKYNWRANLWIDFISGLIVGVAAVPQGKHVVRMRGVLTRCSHRVGRAVGVDSGLWTVHGVPPANHLRLLRPVNTHLHGSVVTTSAHPAALALTHCMRHRDIPADVDSD